jgi:hypothetical protein
LSAAGTAATIATQYFSASDLAAVRLPLDRSEQTLDRSDLAALPNVAGMCVRADRHAAPALFSSAAVRPPAGVVLAGVVEAGFVEAGVVFAGAVFLGVVGGVFDELPQPARRAALASATSNGEYSFRVMSPPFEFP